MHGKILHCIENHRPITFVADSNEQRCKYGDGEHNCMTGGTHLPK